MMLCMLNAVSDRNEIDHGVKMNVEGNGEKLVARPHVIGSRIFFWRWRRPFRNRRSCAWASSHTQTHTHTTH